MGEPLISRYGQSVRDAEKNELSIGDYVKVRRNDFIGIVEEWDEFFIVVRYHRTIEMVDKANWYPHSLVKITEGEYFMRLMEM